MAQLDKMRTELMASSTVTLQRYVRGFLARRRYLRIRKAIVTLQVPAFVAGGKCIHSCECSFLHVWLSRQIPV